MWIQSIKKRGTERSSFCNGLCLIASSNVKPMIRRSGSTKPAVLATLSRFDFDLRFSSFTSK
jgi:hypothetical protein